MKACATGGCIAFAVDGGTKCAAHLDVLKHGRWFRAMSETTSAADLEDRPPRAPTPWDDELPFWERPACT